MLLNFKHQKNLCRDDTCIALKFSSLNNCSNLNIGGFQKTLLNFFWRYFIFLLDILQLNEICLQKHFPWVLYGLLIKNYFKSKVKNKSVA